jgi:hypothetical protein
MINASLTIRAGKVSKQIQRVVRKPNAQPKR